MVRVAAEWLRHQLFELRLNFFHRLPRRQARTIAHPADVSGDGEGFLAKGGVEHHVGSLSAHTGKGLELLARARNLTVVLVDQRL